MKDELDGKIMEEFLAQSPKIYSYCKDEGCAEVTKKV